MISNSGKFENISKDNIEEIQADIEGIDQILKQRIGLITQPIYRGGKTSFISAIFVGFKYFYALIRKYWQHLADFEKKTIYLFIITSFLLFLYPRFLEMLEHISQLPYKIPLEKVHRPISPLISILALLVPYFVPTFILIIVLNAVSVIAFIVLYITRNIKESSSTNFNALNKIKTKAKDDLPNVIDLSKFSSKSLNYYSRQVSYYIKLIESKDKILANLLPILALIYAVSFISFILRSDPKTSTSFF